MNIAVHAKALSESQPTGIGFYVYNVLKALAALDKKNRYTLYSNEAIVQKIKAANFEEKMINFPAMWSYLRLPLEFVGGKYDVLFVPKEMLPPLVRPKTVIVCFDLMGALFADRISMQGRLHYLMAKNYAFKKADRIIAISEATKKDIVEKCSISPEKIIVTHLGYDEKLYRPAAADEIERVRQKYALKPRYVINTSSVIWYRKNIPALIRAFGACVKAGVDDVQLAITGKKGEGFEEARGTAEALGINDKVLFTGYVPLEDMPVLLSGAEALVFPSLHEGFGLPVLEAMACGCPVITSNTSALPEVASNAGMLVNPSVDKEIEAAMLKVLEDKQTRTAMKGKSLERAKLFSWKKTASMTLKVFEGLR